METILKSEDSCEIDIVFAGGGVASGFTCGAAVVLDELLPDGLYQSLNKITGLSAGVGSMLYLLSQPEHFEKHSLDIWIDTVSKKQFLDNKRFWGEHPILDIDYLVDQVFDKLFPINYKNIFDTSVPFRFPVFDLIGRKTLWVGNMNGDWNVGDIAVFRKLVKASMAIPFAYNKKVLIGDGLFMDGAVVGGSQCLEGFDPSKHSIVVLNSGDMGSGMDILKNMIYAVSGFTLGLLYKKYRMPWFLVRVIFCKGFMHRKVYKKLLRLEQQGQLLLIKPTKKIGGVTNNAKEILYDNYQHGKEVVQSRKQEVFDFLAR